MIQIGTDFQGWPVYALTLQNILKGLGFKDEDGKFYIESDAEILKCYPHLLEDDGMGYGVRPMLVTEVDKTINKCKIMAEDFEVNGTGKLDVEKITKEEVLPVFNVFRDVPHNKLNDEDEERIVFVNDD